MPLCHLQQQEVLSMGNKPDMSSSNTGRLSSAHPARTWDLNHLGQLAPAIPAHNQYGKYCDPLASKVMHCENLQAGFSQRILNSDSWEALGPFGWSCRERQADLKLLRGHVDSCDASTFTHQCCCDIAIPAAATPQIKHAKSLYTFRKVC